MLEFDSSKVLEEQEATFLHVAECPLMHYFLTFFHNELLYEAAHSGELNTVVNLETAMLNYFNTLENEGKPLPFSEPCSAHEIQELLEIARSEYKTDLQRIGAVFKFKRVKGLRIHLPSLSFGTPPDDAIVNAFTELGCVIVEVVPPEK